MDAAADPGGETMRNKKRRSKSSDYCDAADKRRYRDARQATRALQTLQNMAREADERGAEHTIHQRRKYRCEACKGWHLTSWETASSAVALPSVRRGHDPLIASLADSTGLARTDFATAA
jgi:hypothetical protein